MSSLRDLQRSLALRIEEVKQRDEIIDSLEREIRQRDRQIRQMQVELDKFKQILKPMTQQLAQNLTIQAMVLSDPTADNSVPGRDGLTTSSKQPSIGLSSLGLTSKAKEERIKRVAISAEPIGKKGSLNPKDLVINKIEKGDK